MEKFGNRSPFVDAAEFMFWAAKALRPPGLLVIELLLLSPFFRQDEIFSVSCNSVVSISLYFFAALIAWNECVLYPIRWSCFCSRRWICDNNYCCLLLMYWPLFLIQIDLNVFLHKMFYCSHKNTNSTRFLA